MSYENEKYLILKNIKNGNRSDFNLYIGSVAYKIAISQLERAECIGKIRKEKYEDGSSDDIDYLIKPAGTKYLKDYEEKI